MADTKDWTWVLEQPCPECGFDAVRPNQWSRRGYRSNGSVFTVESLGRYMVHDLVHHVWDIEQAHPA